MVKSYCHDKSGLRKGAWSPEEDKKLIAYVTRYGHWNWNLLPKFAGLERSGKSCRLRWLNYLRPNIKRGNYTEEEDETIIKLLQRLGNRWSAIAAELPGRTDNEIKNYWHSNLKKRNQQNSKTSPKVQVSKSKVQSPVEQIPTTINAPFQSLPSNSQSNYCCTISCLSEFSITQSDHSAADSNRSFIPEDQFAFLDEYQEPLNGSLWLEPFVDDISYIPYEILVAETHCFSPVRDVQLWSHDNEYCV